MSNDRESTRASGSIDPTFGDKGVLKIPHPNLPNWYLHPTMVVTESPVSGGVGKIYVGCDEYLGGSGIKPLVRLSAEGRLDTGFGNKGYCILPVVEGFFEFQALVFNGDQNITGFGRVYERTDSGVYVYPAAFRITHDGQVDTSFGSGGFIVYRLPVPSSAPLLARYEQDFTRPTTLAGRELSRWKNSKSGGFMPLADGQILFLANIYNGLLIPMVSYLARIKIDGSLDTLFGDQGLVLITDGPDSALVNYAASAIDTKNRIVVVGRVGNKGVVARFDAEGRPDPGFDEDGRMYIAIDQKTCEPRGIISIGDKLIVFCAFFDTAGVESAGLVQLLENGSLDLEFNSGKPAIADFGPDAYVGYDVTVDQGHRLVIGGARVQLPGGTSASAMSRFMPLGMLDPNFGLGGHSVKEDFFVIRRVNIQGIEKIVTVAQRIDYMPVVARFIG